MIPTTNPDSDPTPDYDALVASLRERFGDDLRWVASFDAETYGYDVKYVRPDLRTELTTHEFDVVVHRSVALFRRPYVEEVYSHLGSARTLLVEYERATAVHLYLSDTEGVIIKIRAGNEIPIPGFAEDCFAVLYPDGEERP
jgi:hypothetical protein